MVAPHISCHEAQNGSRAKPREATDCAVEWSATALGYVSPFAGAYMAQRRRAPDRVLAAVFCQTVGHRPENPTVMYRHSKDNWEPDFLKRWPDVSTETTEKYFHNPVRGSARFPLQRLARFHQELSDAYAGVAG